MNNGVEMILERMKTHPEEFEGEQGRWSRMMSVYEKFFTQEEKNLLQNAILQLRRDEFTKKVMEKLLEEPKRTEHSVDSYSYDTGGRSFWTEPTTLSIQEQVLKTQSDAMRQHIDSEMRKQMQEIYDNQPKAKKNKSKMEQLLQAVTKKKQVY